MNRKNKIQLSDRLPNCKEKIDIVIGIDPDVEKSGVCTIYIEEKEIKTKAMSISELIQYFDEVKNLIKETGKSVKVIVEAGYKNGSNWHIKQFYTKNVCSEIGRRTGMNHAASMIIYEIVKKYFKFDAMDVRPLKKIWCGKDGKITHEEFNRILVKNGFKESRRENQDVRDSSVLSLYYGGFKILS